MAVDRKAREVFDTLVQIKVGDGSRVLFWRDKWIRGRAAAEIAPSIVQRVTTRCRNSRTVAQGLVDNRWAEDITGNLSFQDVHDCLTLWIEIQSVDRNPEAADQFLWPSPSKTYTAKSTYDRLWTSDRRFRHGLQDHTSPCFVCLQEEDNAAHVLLQCVTAREVWHICRDNFELDIEEPNY
jgi:hypothetical protein